MEALFESLAFASDETRILWDKYFQLLRGKINEVGSDQRSDSSSFSTGTLVAFFSLSSSLCVFSVIAWKIVK